MSIVSDQAHAHTNLDLREVARLRTSRLLSAHKMQRDLMLHLLSEKFPNLEKFSVLELCRAVRRLIGKQKANDRRVNDIALQLDLGYTGDVIERMEAKKRTMIRNDTIRTQEYAQHHVDLTSTLTDVKIIDVARREDYDSGNVALHAFYV